MTDDLDQLWADLESAFVENDTDTPIHSLLAMKVFQRKLTEGYCRELELPINDEQLDQMIDDLADATEELGGRDAETVRKIADQTEQIAQND